jgi:hypothetical protein
MATRFLPSVAAESQSLNCLFNFSKPVGERLTVLCSRYDFDFVLVKMGMFTLGLPLIQ